MNACRRVITRRFERFRRTLPTGNGRRISGHRPGPSGNDVSLNGAGDDPNERNWRKLTPKPGSLFLVGDPKQSIYRFRRADISIYNEVKSRIHACGDVLHLTSNFRSVDAIGDFVNGQFVGKLPVRETDVQAAYVRMKTNIPNPKVSKKANHGSMCLRIRKFREARMK